MLWWKHFHVNREDSKTVTVNNDEIKFVDLPKTEMMHISIGEEEGEARHVMILYQSHLLQSYWKQYKLKAVKLTEEVQHALDRIHEPGNYKLVTGVSPAGDTRNLKVFYSWGVSQ